jgi:hypothetical protein
MVKLSDVFHGYDPWKCEGWMNLLQPIIHEKQAPKPTNYLLWPYCLHVCS